VTASPVTADPMGGKIVFTWNRWQLVRDLLATTTSFTFYCMPETSVLDVKAPPEWKIDAHMGQNPDALDANGDWVPVDETAENEIFEQFVVGWLQTIGKTEDDLRRALGYRTPPNPGACP